ncbi:MAG: lipid-A-disaccharide synthase-related protein [Pseudanabaenaceae cyanobacterium]
MTRILFISNGHGEDLNASQVLARLAAHRPHWQFLAAPLVGAGQAYSKLGVPIVTPVRNFPSGGFVYMDQRLLWQDIRQGLLAHIWQSLQALVQQQPDFVMAVGDVLPFVGALLIGQPFAAFTVSLSARYTGKLLFPFPMLGLMGHPLCQVIFTRDLFTAELLQGRGYRAEFAGYPIMDLVQVSNFTLTKPKDVPAVALLPGSRVPEAIRNFRLLLNFVRQVAIPASFWAALVPSVYAVLPELDPDWLWLADQHILKCGQWRVHCPPDRFAEILHIADIVVGMAGTAIEQAVGLGKPVIQIPGAGPQFTYRFAEAQMRLLGRSVQTIGTKPADQTTLQLAADCLVRTLQDKSYLAQCPIWGKESVGTGGGSDRIAQRLIQIIES